MVVDFGVKVELDRDTQGTADAGDKRNCKWWMELNHCAIC